MAAAVQMQRALSCILVAYVPAMKVTPATDTHAHVSITMRCMYVLHVIRAPEYGEKYFRPEVEMLSFVRMGTQHILRGS